MSTLFPWGRRRGRMFGGFRSVRLRRSNRMQSYRLAFVAFALLVMLLLLRARSPEPVIAVWHGAKDEVSQMQLEEYVRGVVAAEMPSHFHPEALKAQAVAARTYALRRIEGDMRLSERPDAHVSSDFRVHQAWISRDEFLEQWSPHEGSARWTRIAEAVDATRGVVLTADGALAEALYHSTSGGHTEDAGRYFQTSLPYLVAVPDPYGDHSPVHETMVTMSGETVFEKLGASGVAIGSRSASTAPGSPATSETAGAPGSPATSETAGAPGSPGAPGTSGTTGTQGAPNPVRVEVLSRTDSGRAAEVIVGDQILSGRHVREALGLRSSWFDVAVNGDTVIFHVRGSGHGVGMSQYGADGMGRAGYSYEQILAHFYRGAVLQRRY